MSSQVRAFDMRVLSQILILVIGLNILAFIPDNDSVLALEQDTDLSRANASFIGEEAHDDSGFSLAAAGDVNNDGYADILIGAKGNDDGGSYAGKTYLILGRADVMAWNSSAPLDLSYANASFIGEEASDFSSISIAGAGDVNNDGYADILIGAHQNDEGGNGAGKTYLILGRADVTAWNGSAPLDLSYANASFIGEEPGDRAGESVAGAGDVNNDGYADILIGAIGNKEGGFWAGKTYLILGRADVTAWNGSAPLDLSYANASFIGEEPEDLAGASLAGAGDINSDGYADILIGAEGNSEGGFWAGKTYLILGRTDVMTWNGSAPLDLSYANASFIGEGAEDSSGSSVAGVGDVNSDGYDDILIGAPFNKAGGESAGQIYLLLGRADVMAWNGSAPLDLSYANASFIGEDVHDLSGGCVAGAGDVNSDGFADILIGARGDDDGGDGAGQTYLILGRADVTTWNGSAPLELSCANASFVGENALDESGDCVAGVGDMNNDGFADILIGARGDDDGGSYAGKTYLFLGTLTPIAQQLHVGIQAIDADNLTIVVTLVVEDYYGNELADVQMWVSNGTYLWTGGTNQDGQFNVALSYTTVPFNLEVNATKDGYTPDREIFKILIDLAALTYAEPVPEFNPSVLANLGLLGLVLIGPWLVIWRKRRLRDSSSNKV